MEFLIKITKKDAVDHPEIFPIMQELAQCFAGDGADDCKSGVDTSRTRAEEQKTVAEKANTAPAPAPETASMPETAPVPQYTVEEIRRAFGELARSKGKDAAKRILSELGAEKVTAVPESRYAEAMEKIKAVK